MTPVPANLTINFTARYTGQHRACYRIGSSGPYTCVLTSCTEGPCTAVIPIFVDQETCDTIQYEGYLQAACQDIDSTVDRVSFTDSFVPVPGCKSYTVTCINSSVASATITQAGSGYDPVGPSVIIAGGGGSGATATSTVGNGKMIVGTVNTLTPGSGYTSGVYTNVLATGGSGTGLYVDVVISSGIVQSVAIVAGTGSGYQTTDTLGLTTAQVGGTVTVPATFKAVSDYGTITAINITAPGSGYTSAPTITIAAGSGVQATATAVLATCPAITTDGCSGANVVIPSASIPVGKVISVCNTGGEPAPGVQYTVVQEGNCLCECTSYTLGVTGTVGTQVRYFYNKCGAEMKSGILTVGGSPSSIIDCMVPNSIVFETLNVGTEGTVTAHGSC